MDLIIKSYCLGGLETSNIPVVIYEDERRDPLTLSWGKCRHYLPLCFIPSEVSFREDDDDSALKTITVGLSQKTSQKVTIYEYDYVKTFPKMQKMHKYFLA